MTNANNLPDAGARSTESTLPHDFQVSSKGSMPGTRNDEFSSPPDNSRSATQKGSRRG